MYVKRYQQLASTLLDAVTALRRCEDIVCDREQACEALLLHQRTCPNPELAREHATACVMDAPLTECAVRDSRCCTLRLLPEPVASARV